MVASVAAVLVAGAAAAAAVSIPASDARVTWTGRYLMGPGGGVTFDWEGTQAKFAVTGAT